jgi:hypothetical protein
MPSTKPIVFAFCAIVTAATLAPISADACPPPPIRSAPPQLPNEADETYYDRLASWSGPYGWGAITGPTQVSNETAQAFGARAGPFYEGMRLAFARRDAAQLVALDQQEAYRWEQAPQVLLVESGGTFLVRSEGEDWIQTRFRVISRVRGTDRLGSVTLRFPQITSGCGFIVPTFGEVSRLVMFANSGPISWESLIGYYDFEAAHDHRTRELLELPPTEP